MVIFHSYVKLPLKITTSGSRWHLTLQRLHILKAHRWLCTTASNTSWLGTGGWEIPVVIIDYTTGYTMLVPTRWKNFWKGELSELPLQNLHYFVKTLWKSLKKTIEIASKIWNGSATPRSTNHISYGGRLANAHCSTFLNLHQGFAKPQMWSQISDPRWFWCPL